MNGKDDFDLTVRALIHELKNSLMALSIQSENLKESLPQKNAKDIEAVDNEIARLTNLVNGFGEYIKNPVGNPEKTDIVAFVKKTADLFGFKIEVLSSVEKAYVFFDADRLRSVFENLIKNACESNDGKDAEVKIKIDSLNGKISIQISDRGKGISDEIRGKLFDPFFTTKEQGSGIGLSISKQFVQAQGGSLELTPREGGGVVASVELPECLK